MSERADIDIAARLGGAPRNDAQRTARAATTLPPTRPFARFEWMLAFRYLRPKRKEAVISLITIVSFVGIALGVAALIIVMSVMNGFRHDLMARILGLNGHVLVQGAAGELADFDRVAARVRAVPGVARVAPIVDGQVMATEGGTSLGVLVRGMRQADLQSLTMVSNTLSPGALARFKGGDSVIIGARLADRLRLYPGMTITLISPRGNVTPFGTTPRVKSYYVAGTFKIGMTEYDQSVIFMPLEEAQLYFNLEDRVSSLEIMVDDPDNLHGATLNGIAAAAGPYVRVLSWEDMNSTLFGALQVEANVMFLILSIIVVVGAFNIFSSMVMLVKDKGSDIAILRTMGATRGAMMRVFLIAGCSIGIVGTLFGFLIGYAFCANIENLRLMLNSLTGTTLFDPTIYFLSHMPSRMETSDIVWIVSMAIALSLLATLYPSWRAARLDPVEALRYE